MSIAQAEVYTQFVGPSVRLWERVGPVVFFALSVGFTSW